MLHGMPYDLEIPVEHQKVEGVKRVYHRAHEAKTGANKEGISSTEATLRYGNIQD